MNGIAWEEPPPAAETVDPKPNAAASFARSLQANPGRWAKYRYPMQVGRAQFEWANRGYETRTLTDPDSEKRMCEMWVRWVEGET